jgi:hypothetical protein
MMDRADWLRERRPPAPEALRDAVRDALAHSGPGPIREAADRASHACLAHALARPGRVRESAFALLTADALVTYACEAALDEDDAVRALELLLTIGDRP